MTYFRITKEKLTSLEVKSSDLMNENQKLKIRAASAWEELTPRPDLFRVIRILGIDPIGYQGFGSKQLANELIELVSGKIRITKSTSASLSPALLQMLPSKGLIKQYLQKKSSYSRDSSEEKNVTGFEEIKGKEVVIINKKNTLAIVNELVMKEGNREDPFITKHSRKSIIINDKRRFLLSLEKNDDGIKRRICSPRKKIE